MSAVDTPGEVHIAVDPPSNSILSQQYAHHFLHIAGQQELRLPAKRKLSSLYCMAAFATTDRNALGCSIWVSRLLPYLQNDGRSYCFSSQHLFVVYAIPYILVVDVDVPYLCMHSIPDHAPIEGDYMATTAFLSLSEFLAHLHEVLLFIDADSCPEENVSASSPGCNPYSREAATQFSDFLPHNSMTSTRSIGMLTRVIADTWTPHSASMSFTIDYVVQEDEDAAGIVSIATLPSADNGHMVQDHVPSAATFTFQITADRFRSQCNRARVTKAQVEEPTDRAAFANDLVRIPSVAWHALRGQHYSQLAAQVSQDHRETISAACCSCAHATGVTSHCALGGCGALNQTATLLFA